MRAFETTYASGAVDRPLVYELEGDRFLFVFDPNGMSLPGKGDIYPGDFFRRWAPWHARARDDELRHVSSVGHWFHFSKLQAAFVHRVDALVSELAVALGPAATALDFGYASLDPVSRHVDTIGIDAACESLYDPLVAYVGEVVRRRTHGEWRLADESSSEPHPYIAAAKHAPIMPINVVWGELTGYDPVELRKSAANEVRSAKARFF